MSEETQLKLGMDGVAIVAAERQRHYTEEGWSPEHDDEHEDESLALAAAIYAWPKRPRHIRDHWPWQPDEYKPEQIGGLTQEIEFVYARVRVLAKAGALVCAEIDRLRRASGLVVLASVIDGEATGVPMCEVHKAIEKTTTIPMQVGNDCVVCSLTERTELLKLLEKLAPEDGSKDSVTVLTELIAEVERLRRGDFTPAEFQNLCHNTNVQEGFSAFAFGCIEYQRKLFGTSIMDLGLDPKQQLSITTVITKLADCATRLLEVEHADNAGEIRHLVKAGKFYADLLASSKKAD